MKTRASDRGRGFTLLELLVVVFIITILVGVVIGVSQIVLRKASYEQTRTNMQVILQAIEAYRETDENGVYPPQRGSDPALHSKYLLEDLTANPAARAKLAALPKDAIKYIQPANRLVDGYENPIDYDPAGGVGGTPVLISAGADRDYDTQDDNIRSDNR